MDLTSTAFGQGGMIPAKYSCDGSDVSPPLAWDNAPTGTKSFALICDDPDAPMGTWVHWVYFDIPAATKSLPEHIETARAGMISARSATADPARLQAFTATISSSMPWTAS